MSAIGAELLSQPYHGDEKKKRLMRGDYLFAAKETFDWYVHREEYIELRALVEYGGAPSEEERLGAFWSEVAEYNEAMVVYGELATRKRLNKDWYLGEDAEKIWKLVGEHADVHIVAASLLQRDAWNPEEVANLWRDGGVSNKSAKGWLSEYMVILEESKGVLPNLGVDFAELILAKLEINDQHYPKELWPWVMVFPFGKSKRTFTRNMRGMVGDASSQMPSLVMSRRGETILAELHKSPFGSNGYGPKAIEISAEIGVTIAASDADQSYGLYTLGYIASVTD